MSGMNEPTSPPWEPGTRLVASVLLLLFLGWLVYSLRQLATPLILALVLAYLLHPLVSKLVEWTHMPRWLAVIIFYLLLITVMIGATTGLGLAVSQQLAGVIDDLSDLANQIPSQLEVLQNQVFRIGPWEFDLSQINISPFVEQLSSTVQPLLLGTGSLLASVAGTAASAVGAIFLVMVIGFYMLLDFDKMKDVILDLVPETHLEDVRDLIEETAKIWQAFLRGQLILGVVIGSIVAIVLSAVGVRFALGLGLIAGLLEFVPIFGPVISGIIAGLVALFQSGNYLGLSPLAYMILILGIFVLIQQIENNILVPRIIGHSLNLNPLIVLVAALAGSILAGVLGILLAAPVFATLRLWLGYIYRKIAGLGTLPEPVLVPPPHRETPRILLRINRWFRDIRSRKKAEK
jgi:predicted PurR-regulated permease PerM